MISDVIRISSDLVEILLFFYFLVLEEALMAMIQLLIAIFTGGAACAACFAVYQARKASRGELMGSILKDYASAEMRNAMNCLVEFAIEWDIDEDRDFAEHYQNRLKVVRERRSDRGGTGTLDLQRRIVSHHFLWISRLLQNKYIDRRFVRAVAPKDKVEFHKYIIEPLEKEIHPDYDRKCFEILQKIYGIADKPNDEAGRREYLEKLNFRYYLDVED